MERNVVRPLICMLLRSACAAAAPVSPAVQKKDFGAFGTGNDVPGATGELTRPGILRIVASKDASAPTESTKFAVRPVATRRRTATSI
jgi:hypothetical protein